MNKPLFCIVGPSGSGKTTLANRLKMYGLKPVESYTTRPERFPGEPGHVFVTDKEFEQAGPMMAFTVYNGYEYGIPKERLDLCDVYVIDPLGVETLRLELKDERELIVFALQTHNIDTKRRMLNRGDDPLQTVERVDEDARTFEDYLEKADMVFDASMPIDLLVSLVAQAIAAYNVKLNTSH